MTKSNNPAYNDNGNSIISIPNSNHCGVVNAESEEPEKHVRIGVINDTLGHRVITIAYKLYLDDERDNDGKQCIKYAGSIFNYDIQDENGKPITVKYNEKTELPVHYCRKIHSKTARDRFKTLPLFTKFNFSEEMLDILLGKNVPKGRKARSEFLKSPKGEEFEKRYKACETILLKFLRRKIHKDGVRQGSKIGRREVPVKIDLNQYSDSQLEGLANRIYKLKMERVIEHQMEKLKQITASATT